MDVCSTNGTNMTLTVQTFAFGIWFKDCCRGIICHHEFKTSTLDVLLQAMQGAGNHSGNHDHDLINNGRNKGR